MKLKFKYWKLTCPPTEAFPKTKSIVRPIINVALKYQKERLRYLVLLDTGSDYCLFPESIGEKLGIAVRNGKKWEFSGSTARGGVAYFHNITLEIGGWDHKCYAGFCANLDELQYGYGILGNVGFFDTYQAIFNFKKNTIEIEKET